jgi:hypothetical protein
MTKTRASLNALFLAFGGAMLATACTVTLDPNGGGDDSDAQCLELFETCVELAGDSPGCNAVFEYCAGSASGGDDGGGEPDPNCEEDYIQCLSEGLSPDECEPLLVECFGGGDDGGGGDGGGCVDADDPDCEPCPDDGCEPPPPPADCEQLLETCVSLTGEEAACEGLLDACYAGDCDAMLGACYDFGGEEALCQELTGCGSEPPPPPGDDCDDLFGACIEETGGDEELCVALYPECFGGEPTEPGNCEWYYSDECHAQFASNFCEEGAQGCEVGILPEYFECGAIFPDYCWDISDTACAQAADACQNGFFDVELCGSLADDPSLFLQQLAECNGWE